MKNLRSLGHSDLLLSPIGLGTWQFLATRAETGGNLLAVIWFMISLKPLCKAELTGLIPLSIMDMEIQKNLSAVS